MTGSRFLPSTPSRFFHKMATPVSRFIVRHRKLHRIVQRIPIVTKFLTFFVPDELALRPPELAPQFQQPAPEHIAPVYNRSARRPKGLTFG